MILWFWSLDFWYSEASVGAAPPAVHTLGVVRTDAITTQAEAQARRYAEFAVEARPDDPWAHGQLGYIYARTSEFDEDAKQYREKAIEQYEESVAHAYSPVSAASSYCSLGFAHQENQNPEQAIINYRLCADHSPNEQDRIWAEERIANLSTAP